MVSVKNSDCELQMKPDAIGEEEPADVKGKISEDGGGDGSNGERVSNSRVTEQARVSEMELDSQAPEAEVGPRVPAAGESEEVRVKREVSKESDGGGVCEEMEAKGSEIKAESSSAEEGIEEEEEEEEGEGEAEKSTGSQYNSLLSEFDDFVANEKSGQMATSRALRYGFEVGDMVWGKVKSHPWWPGHIFSDAFASPQVRRTRREGHVLVAFFGDSSYGWFDPAELIPFEANLVEKSRQTVSKNFTKAVEEAVDELSRRCSLGLACKCRNPYSFRPTSVQGYFVVDVPDYEPRAIYSATQIQKGRDGFNPSEILSFIKQLALSPCIGDEKDLNFIKSKAQVVAYRKAIFEEFDETYAQAFGAQPGRPARDRNDLKDQLSKQPPRAPLSGPLVIAETLGGGTSATKHMKVKGSSKKDRYLFKRRDESGNLKSHQSSQGQVNSSAPSASAEGSVAAGDGDFALLNRASAASSKPQAGAVLSSNGREAAARGCLPTQDVSIDIKPSLDKGKGALEEVKEESGSGTNSIVASKDSGTINLSGNVALSSVIDGSSQSLKHDDEGSVEYKHEEVQQPQLTSTITSDENHGTDQVQDGSSLGGPSPAEAKGLAGMSIISGVKKTKVKRPREEPRTENPTMEGKKKKKKKQLGTETGFRDPQKQIVSKKVSSSTEKKMGKKATRTGLASKEERKVEKSKRNVASGNNLSDSVGTSPFAVVGNTELELPRLLRDLQLLALDPAHGVESSPVMVRKFFLRFRSLVYQKSLVLSPPSEVESTEARPSKASASVGASENNSVEPVRDVPSSKPSKPFFRSDDPTIAGRKRASSDRQEEIAAKRSKKVGDIRTLAAEKKAVQKTLESQRMGEGRETAIPLGRKNRPDTVKKLESPSRSVEPTMLVMKFPLMTTLPSPAELKARFARFGPMDQSALRVFWKSSTCRVVFLHKSDAQAALKFAAANSSLFGTPGMRCHVREFGTSGPDIPEPGKVQGTDENPPIDNPRIKDSPILQRPPSATMQPSVQLKSCLKKSTPDDSGPPATGPGSIGGTNTRGTPRVKFMLAGEESPSTSRVEASIAGNRNNPNNNNSASFADGGALVPSTTTTTSVGMDFSVRNIEKVIPQTPLPILPLPPQYAKTPLNNSHHHHNQHHDVMMVGPRNTHNPSTSNISATGAPPSSNSVDISQQMLSLLTRCNDVVTNVTGLLGYVPYHPL